MPTVFPILAKIFYLISPASKSAEPEYVPSFILVLQVYNGHCTAGICVMMMDIPEMETNPEQVSFCVLTH